MSEKAEEQQAEAPAVTQQEAVIAALPVIESPTISPDPVAEDAVAEKPAGEPVAAAVEATPSAASIPNATARFRTAAAAQIAAARERIEKRNAPSVVAVALVAGLTGAASTAALSSANSGGESIAQIRALENSVARMDDVIAALRNDIERNAQLRAEDASKTGERIANIEKAQAEPTAKLSKLAELVDRLRNVTTASQAPAGDVTGSIAPPPASPVPAKLKLVAPVIVEGWALRELDRDVALVEGKRGLFEIAVGDTIPGVGRVEAFRKHDGRWAVVTAKGLIVSR